jgi:hypothetical protein
VEEINKANDLTLRQGQKFFDYALPQAQEQQQMLATDCG